MTRGKRRRKTYKMLRRMKWSEFCLRDEFFLNRALRMSLSSFTKLVMVLDESLKVDSKMGSIRGGEIEPSLAVFATLRWLAGGSYLDISALCGMSKTTFFEKKDRVLMAIVASKNPLLDNIHFPQSHEECSKAAAGFQSKSFSGAMKNVVSVLDGYLLRIQVPCVKDVGNVRSFFNGHYQCYGVNLQAACDSECRFTFIGAAGPGVMPDRDAVNQVALGKLIEKVPEGYCSIGDPAYFPTNRLVAIFGGDEAKVRSNDNFNYYASQLRIRIEMAFGTMQNKWRILQSPLRYPIKKMKYLVLTLARLHNFCLNERIRNDERKALGQELQEGVGVHYPSQPQDRDGTPLDDDCAEEHGYSTRTKLPKGNSATRLAMVRHIRHLGLCRPLRSTLAGRADRES